MSGRRHTSSADLLLPQGRKSGCGTADEIRRKSLLILELPVYIQFMHGGVPVHCPAFGLSLKSAKFAGLK
jgi:hypothetical protein